ncbi:MAG: hypothetical protein ABSE97_06440 [Verrucomicrobiota bacterium]
MKTTVRSLGLVILGIGLFIGCAKKPPASSWSLDQSEASAPLKAFISEKETQANAAVKAEGQEMLPEFKSFFVAAGKGDWLTVSNMFMDFRNRAPQYEHPGASDPRLRGIQWQALLEIYGMFEDFANGDEKYPIAFGRDIIRSIPAGSIYFGGTDPGRFLVTALCKSQINADPFFALTQNALADMTYLDYLRSMYGDKIYIPTKEDSQKCFDDFVKDAQERMQNGQLKPGENFTRDSNGKIQVSGQVAVMELNALLVKVIFDKNPSREFYIEESFPLDWMYPYLEPHDLIMKINRQPLSALSAETVRHDHDYWSKYVSPMIGDWLNDDIPVEDVTAFVEKVYLKQDFSGFKGDPHFLQNMDAQKWFSKLRTSIASVYVWRAQHASDSLGKERMNNEADFAFRQAFALCPYSPEAVFRYVNFLLGQQRSSDAVLVASTCLKLDPENAQVKNLVNQLKRTESAK